MVQAESTTNGRQRLCFIADLPPLGYRTYRIVQRPSKANFPPVSADNSVCETASFRLEFDPDTGLIKSLRDKRHGLEVFRGAAARPVVIDDKSDTWSHNVFAFDQA